MSNDREHLATFISEVEKIIPLQRVWMKKGEYTLSKLSTFRDENPRTENDYRSFMNAETKALFVKVGIPFTIVSIREVQSNFRDERTGEYPLNYHYDIDVDTESREFQGADMLVNLETQYTLTVLKTPFRKREVEEVLNDYIRSGQHLKLIKVGKAYDFEEVA